MQSESIESQLAEEKCLMEQKYASMLQQVLAEKQLVRCSVDNMSLHMHNWGAQIRGARIVHYLVLVLSPNFCIMKQLIAIPQNREVLNFVLSVLRTVISNLLFSFLNLRIYKVFLSL